MRSDEGDSTLTMAPGIVSAPSSTSSRAKRSVLVVDDEPSILGLLKALLDADYIVFCAKNTREADAIIQAHPINAVVCDHFMPIENGLSFLVRLRNTHPHISRILLSGCTVPEVLLAAINQSGVQRYLIKPINVFELKQALGDAMREYDTSTRHMGLGKENADLRSSIQKVLSRSASLTESPAKLLAISFLGLLAVLAVALLLGLLVFVLLYSLKSALGIDFLPNWSHTDGL